jgi:hypothetical protein
LFLPRKTKSSDTPLLQEFPSLSEMESITEGNKNDPGSITPFAFSGCRFYCRPYLPLLVAVLHPTIPLC